MLGNLCTKHSNTIHLGMMLAFHLSLEQNKMVLRENSAVVICVHAHTLAYAYHACDRNVQKLV